MSVHGTDYDAIAMAAGGELDDGSHDSDMEEARVQHDFAGAGPPVEEVEVAEPEVPVEPPPKKKRRTHSVAHDDLEDLILLSIDLETGGEAVGIIQISCVAYNPETGDSFEFDEHVKPPPHVSANYWSETAINITGIRPNGPEMSAALGIEEVWPKFTAFCAEQVPMSKVGCLVAWNGQASDCKWLFRLVEEQYKGRFEYPARVYYFMDPQSSCEPLQGLQAEPKAFWSSWPWIG